MRMIPYLNTVENIPDSTLLTHFLLMGWPFDFVEHPNWYVFILYSQTIFSTFVLFTGIIFVTYILPASTSRLYKQLLLFHMIINYISQICISSGSVVITILPMCGGYTLGFFNAFGLGTCVQLALSVEFSSVAALSTIYLFFYRHQVLVPIGKLSARIFLVTITVAYVVFPGLLFYYECNGIDQINEKIKFVDKYHLNYPRFWEPQTIVFPNSIKSGVFWAMSFMALLLIFMIIVIFYFVCRLHFFLSSKALSSRTLRMHRTLTKTLIYQTLVNYVLVFLPTTGIIASCSFGLPIPGFSNLCYVIYSFSDACGILAMIASHSSYRQRFYKLLSKNYNPVTSWTTLLLGSIYVQLRASVMFFGFQEYPLWYVYGLYAEGFFSTILLFVAFIFIVFALPRATMRFYKRLLAVSLTVNYLAQSCMTMGTMPVTMLPVCGGYTLGFLNVFQFSTCIQFAVSCHMVAMSAAFTIYLFYYRKSVILPFPKLRGRIYLITVGVLYFFVPGPLFYFECQSIDQTHVKMEDYIKYQTDFPRYWNNETVVFRTTISTEVFWALMFLMFLIMLMFGSIVFILHRLLNGLKAMTLSETTKRMHKSLMMSLLWQTGMTYAVFCLPMGAIILGCAFHLPYPAVANFCYMTYATSNACGIIAMIGSHRSNKRRSSIAAEKLLMTYAKKLLHLIWISLCVMCLMITQLEGPGILVSRVAIRKSSLAPLPAVPGRRIDNTEESEFNAKVAIVEVISDRWKVNETAIGSVQCYAEMKGHYMYLLNLMDHMAVCGHHKDFFYRRHCAVANLLENTNHDWYVFIDSDMELVNPFRSFREFMDDKHEVYLYDRFWNWEIMAGSYIIKGTKFGKAFVRGFANFEFIHPQIADHGTDNGAIQAYVAEVVLGGRDKIHECWNIWYASKGWDNMFDHEWCVRRALGAAEDLGRVKVFRKGTAWARDGGITQGKWSLDFDFLLHGRKESQKKVWTGHFQGGWYDTRLHPLDLAKCHLGNEEWKFNEDMLVNRSVIVKNLKDSARGIVGFLRGVYMRINKTEVIENDLKNNQDIIDRFSLFNETEEI